MNLVTGATGFIGNVLVRKLADQLGNHLSTNTRAAIFVMDRKIKYMETSLVQLVDHEADHLVIMLGNHPDAIALPQAAYKILFVPGKFKA